MKTRLLLPARRELTDAIRYYKRQYPRLGDEFRDEAWETIRRIIKFPHAWHPLSGTIRRCQMQRFPYGIIYKPFDSEILIISIAHLHQAPDHWRSRVP